MVMVIVVILLIFVAGSGAVVARVYGQVRARESAMEANFNILKEEIETRRGILEKIGQHSLGLTSADTIEALNSDLVRSEDELRSEQGRITITQAELDAIESRLRELEEIERELEASSIEASREVEMLRSQERDVRARNDALRAQLESSMLQIDNLLNQLQSSHAAQEQLTRLKGELIETQEKTEWYTEEICKLNEKYLALKKAYDAIDIEYAQLYEKHNALEAAAQRG